LVPAHHRRAITTIALTILFHSYTASSFTTPTSSTRVTKIIQRPALTVVPLRASADHHDGELEQPVVSTAASSSYSNIDTTRRNKRWMKKILRHIVPAFTIGATTLNILPGSALALKGETKVRNIDYEITERILQQSVREASKEKAEYQKKLKEFQDKGDLVGETAFKKEYRLQKNLKAARMNVILAEKSVELLQDGVSPQSAIFEAEMFKIQHGVDLYKYGGGKWGYEMNERMNMSEGERAREKAKHLEEFKKDLEDAIEYLAIQKKRLADFELAANPDPALIKQKEAEEAKAKAEADKVAKQQAKEEAKMAAAEAKAQAKAEKQAAKEAAKEAKAKAKAEKMAAKESAAKEAAAAALALSGTAATQAAAGVASEAAGALTDAAASAGEIVSEDAESSEAVEGGFDLSDATQEELDAAAISTVKKEESKIEISKKNKIIRTTGLSLVAGAAAFKGWTIYREKAAEDEEKRMEQYKLIMGIPDDAPSGAAATTLDDDIFAAPSSDASSSEIDDFSTDVVPPPVAEQPAVVPPPAPKKKKKKGIASIFSKKDANARETDLNALFAADALAPNFCMSLAGILTFGAPGRFPDVEALPGRPSEFVLEDAKEALSKARETEGLTNVLAAESFACVVNCMIITIIDLASSTLKEEDKITVDALNVVLDFMDHAASLYDAIADGVVITPVTYSGSLGNKKLEQMFTKFASVSLGGMDLSAQERVDTLQQVFKISDKKAEGLIQKVMMKNLMKMMKDGGEGLEGMEGMPGMEEMMAAMGGGEGMGGLGGLGGGDVSPEELKQSVEMMKQLLDSGQVSKEELDLIRQQFKDANGMDLTDLIKATEGMGTDELGDDGKELLDLFKKVLDE